MELGEEDAITWKSLGKYSIRDMADLFRDIAVDNVCCHSETEGCRHNVFCQACYALFLWFRPVPTIYIRSVALHSDRVRATDQIRAKQRSFPRNLFTSLVQECYCSSWCLLLTSWIRCVSGAAMGTTLTAPPSAGHGPDDTANDLIVGEDGGLTFIRGGAKANP
jgi:hypothetical protein